MSRPDGNISLPWNIRRPALISGLAGFLACSVGALWSPSGFFHAYLVAYNFWLGIGLGCLVLLMVQYLTGGAWGVLLRRILEAGTRTLPLLIVMFVPLLIGLRYIYPWVGEAGAESESKRLYLSLPFYLGRTAVYFAIWFALGYFLNRWSALQDQENHPAPQHRFQVMSGPGLILYAVTVTLASVDWVMSLEPDWASTIYPPLFAAGQVLTGLAFALEVLLLLAGRPPFSAIIRPNHLRDLGNLLLTFVMLWAYMSFSQFLLIWSENLPEEIPWYLRRTREGWQIIAVILVVFQFGLPFLLLLSRQVKQRQHALAGVAALVLVMRFFDLLWLIAPAHSDQVIASFLMGTAAWIALGALFLWYFAWQLEKKPLLPLHDPYVLQCFPEASGHE